MRPERVYPLSLRLLRDQEAVGSSPLIRTITSVLIGFEHPIRTLVFYAHFASLPVLCVPRSIVMEQRSVSSVMGHTSPGLHRDLRKRNIHLIRNLNRTDTGFAQGG